MKKKLVRKVNRQTGVGKFTDEVAECLDYMNEVTGRTFSTAKDLPARFAEGHSVDDVKMVISGQYNAWRGTRFEVAIRPKTLFAVSNFEGYLNNARRGSNEIKQATNQQLKLSPAQRIAQQYAKPARAEREVNQSLEFVSDSIPLDVY